MFDSFKKLKVLFKKKIANEVKVKVFYVLFLFLNIQHHFIFIVIEKSSITFEGIKFLTVLSKIIYKITNYLLVDLVLDV